MKRFSCRCGQRLFFENTSCASCGRATGYDPKLNDMVALDSVDHSTGLWSATGGVSYRLCQNGSWYQACNWLLPAATSAMGETLCVGCSLTETIPNLSRAESLALWRRMEEAKRRLLYGLLQLRLPLTPPPLRFHFLQDQRSNPLVEEEHVSTGHLDGQITINLMEADAVERESTRVAFHEAYRTLLGNFRHESGHYFWLQLIDLQGRTAAFRALFGDEREDYQTALQRHHQQGPAADWQARCISAYASSHPHEDWAETWGHYLHIVDALESAVANGLLAPYRAEDWLNEWLELSIGLNELNRSVGMGDAYPFALANPVIDKLEFIHALVQPHHAAA